MFNQRNNPLYRAIKDVVDSGAIGKIHHSSWLITTWWRPQGYYDQCDWRATWGGEGGGVLVTATHDLVGTDRFEILGDNGKIVVENSLTTRSPG